MNRLLFQSLTQQIASLRQGSITSSALLQMHLDQHEHLHPSLNALVQINPHASEQAAAADHARARGESWGPLHGTLFTVKDSLDTAGMISTAGTTGRRNHIPQRDATAVARLRAAGAIVLGKTNCSELVMPFETDNLVYGRTNNPWNPAHTPGGSSGGEAAWIAAGGSPLGIAGDAGASIRAPAHFCGVAGIKPTTGRVPRSGHFPTMGGVTGPLAAIGVLARTIGDLVLTLPLLCGEDGQDTACVPVPWFNPAAVNLRELRVAYFSDNSIMPASPETAQAVRQAAAALRDAGAQVSEARPDGLRAGFDIFNSLFGADGGLRMQQFLTRIGSTEVSPALEQTLSRLTGSRMDTADFMTLLGRVDKFRAEMLAFMQHFDLIICPVAAIPAPLHGGLLGADSVLPLSYTMTINLAGYPAAAVPAMLSEHGLPIGVQVVAGAWREDRVLAAALHIEQALGGYRQPRLAL